MADPVGDFVNTVHEQQQTLSDKRADTADALVEHMLTLPGMADIFDTPERKSMLGSNMMMIVESAARDKATMPPPIEEPELPPEMAPQNGDDAT